MNDINIFSTYILDIQFIISANFLTVSSRKHFKPSFKCRWRVFWFSPSFLSLFFPRNLLLLRQICCNLKLLIIEILTFYAARLQSRPRFPFLVYYEDLDRQGFSSPFADVANTNFLAHTILSHQMKVISCICVIIISITVCCTFNRRGKSDISPKL